MGDLEVIEVIRGIFNDRMDDHEKNIDAKISSLVESQKVTNEDLEKTKRETRFIRGFTKSYDKNPTKTSIKLGLIVLLVVGVANVIRIEDVIMWIKTLI